jgi:hypothetical protein
MTATLPRPDKGRIADYTCKDLTRVTQSWKRPFECDGMKLVAQTGISHNDCWTYQSQDISLLEFGVPRASIMRLFRSLAYSFAIFASSFAFTQGIPSLTTEQWAQDLPYLANEIKTKHRDPYHLISKVRFDADLAAVESRIPSMKNYEVVVGLQRLAALIGDGHTFVDTSKLYQRLPIEVFWFGNDLRVVRAAPEYKTAIGTKIVRVGSTEISEVKRQLQVLISQGESEWFVMDRSAGLITQIEPLAALRIIPYSDTAAFTFETDSGSRFTLQLRAEPPVESRSLVMLSDHISLPFQHPEAPLWFTYLPDSQTLYVDFRSYEDLQQETKPLWESIAQHPVRRMIIDMRWNGGGNYVHGREYLVSKITFMPQVNRAGHLFVITGRRTFSAGMTNVTDFRRETEAIIVGEPTGARPNGYQENYWFTLPFSQIRVSCATLKYRFQPYNDSAGVLPDHRIDPDWDMFRAGEDAAINWILTQPLPEQ